MSLALPIIIGYSLLQILLGLWMGRRVKSADAFFVAGRGLGPALLFSTLVAANIGAGSTVGAAGLGYRDGVAAWWWVGSAGLGSLVLAFVVGPRMRALAAAHGLRTVGDFLELRYDRRVRAAVTALLWLGTLAILSGQLIAVAWVLNAVVGTPKWMGCLAGGTVMTIYFAAGGLQSAVVVNAMQLVLELVVFASLVPLALASAGGLERVVALAPQDPGYWNFFSGGLSGFVYVALLSPAFIISPGQLQKVYAARDDRAVRWGVGLNAAVLLLFAGIPALLGIVARALHPGLANHELALPTLLMSDLPPLVGALALAAVFSTEVNTADAILFILSTSLSQDLYKRFLNPGASDRQVLRVARSAAVAGGAAGVALAIVAESVIGVLSVFYTLLGVCLFVPVLEGLYVRRVKPRAMLWALGAGVALTLLVHFGAPSRRLGPLPSSLVGIATVAALAFGLTRARAAGRPSGFPSQEEQSP
jgi:SSS family solute:Na+ symporter